MESITTATLTRNMRSPHTLEAQLNVLTEVSKTLATPLELPELLSAVLRRIAEVLPPAQVGVVMLWDQSSGLFRAEASFGYQPDALRSIGLRQGEAITGKVYDAGKACLLATPGEVNQAMSDMRPANRNLFQQAIGSEILPLCVLAAPLQVGGERLGVLVLQTLCGPDRFIPEELPFIQSIADLIALAIDRARLQARADAIRLAGQEERMRSEVMAALSHQLRMPLSTIKGFASALLLEELAWNKAQQREFLRFIDEECDTMETLIAEMLDSALIDIGQLKIEPEPLRLPHLALDIANEIQRRTDLHRLIVDFPPEFPLVEADLHWIKQAFRNILDNAIKYAPQGGLVVVRGEVRPGSVVISIADQGLGISPEDLIPLFEKYFRARDHNGHQIRGTGLGLPIARAIIEAHAGRIWAESRLGEGTTIFFSLPTPTQEDGG